MWIYTIINTMVTGIITIPLYIFHKTNYYKENAKMKDDIEICLKEIESLHKSRMEIENNLINIISTMKFTGTDWQQKFVEKKLKEIVYKHYGDCDLME